MIDFRRYTLPNGLRVIHSYDPSKVMVSVDVLYNTGARDEKRELTGIAHLFEHLMFGGSVNIAEFDKELENAGGVSNAWTSNDFTNFFETLPAINIETALHLESDRMFALAFSHESLEVQRSVVIEEFKQQCLNRPYGNLMHGLRDALYSRKHPYSWPVIGLEPQHISKVTDEDVRQWFYSHYAPNNAVLAIAGNLPYKEGRAMVEKWFGDIPRREIEPRRLDEPGFPKESIVRDMTGHVPYPNVVVAIPMSRYGTNDYRVTDCITDILSAGRSSRYLQNLVLGGDGSIIEADASISGSYEEGFVMLTARPSDNKDSTLEHVAKLLLSQLEKLSEPGNVTSYELERTLNKFESTFLMQNLDLTSIAQNLAMSEMHDEDINNTVALQRTITTDDIERVAKTLMETPKVTIRYRPEN